MFGTDPLQVLHPFEPPATAAYGTSYLVLHGFTAWTDNCGVRTLTPIEQVKRTGDQHPKNDGGWDALRHLRWSGKKAATGYPLSQAVHNRNTSSRKPAEERSALYQLLPLGAPNLPNLVCCTLDPHVAQLVELFIQRTSGALIPFWGSPAGIVGSHWLGTLLQEPGDFWFVDRASRF